MTKILLVFLMFLTSKLFAQTEFTSKEAISYFNKPYREAKAEIIKKGYQFDDKFEDFYTYQKIKRGKKLTCTFTISHDRVQGIVTEEYYSSYTSILTDIHNEGFIFNQGGGVEYPSGEKTEFDEAPSSPIPSSITKFNKLRKFTCSIICPYNLGQGNDLISVSYSAYKNN